MSNMKTLKVLALAATLSTSAAAVPETFLYVGDLQEDGAAANGSFSVTFQMFDDESAGTLVFAETLASIDVTDGALIHELGSQASNPLDEAELAAGELYLQVIVNGSVLSPRTPIRSVPFAARAALAEVADNASSLAGVSLASIADGSALADGSVQARHLSGLAKLFEQNLACINPQSLTTSNTCLALTDGCSGGQHRPCNLLFTGNCVAPSAGSRNCTNEELGSLVFAP